MEQINRDHYRLSTGREFYANCGIVGLAPKRSDRNWVVYEGYDGAEYDITNDPARYYDPEDKARCWTAEERRELADYMIALWTQFRSEQG